MKNLHKRSDATYEARIRLPGSRKVIYRTLQTKNKRVATKRLDDLYRQLELQQVGLLPAPIADQKLKPLMLKYLSDLSVTSSSDDYINRVTYRLQSVAEACSWLNLSDVSATGFIEWRSGITDLMPKTLNDYLSAWRAFFSWLVKFGHVDGNPFKTIKRIPIRGRVSFRRRAFTDEEIRALIQLPERRALYLTALFTGLRRGELAKLWPSDFHLDEKKPFLRLRPEITKNGKEGLMYLHPELVLELEFIRNLEQQGTFFPLLRPRVFYADCKKAGIQRESGGRRVDFHSLRVTFCTRLAKSGVSPQVAKELMRHSDIRMTTEIYTDTGLLGVDSVLSIPGFAAPPQNPPQNRTKKGHILDKANPVAVLVKLAEVLDLQADELAETFSRLVEVRGVEPLTS